MKKRKDLQISKELEGVSFEYDNGQEENDDNDDDVIIVG